jgi:hypothetical protein
MENRKYDYTNVEEQSGFEYKLSMAAVALYILYNLGYLGLGSGAFGIIVSTGLAIFIWWSFRAYFVKVGDLSSSKWLLFIIVMYAVFGFCSLVIRELSDFYVYLMSHESIYAIFKLIMYVLIFSLAGFVLVGIRLIAANRHHSFPLKRIALSAAVCIPISLLISMISNIQFFGQVKELADTFHEADVLGKIYFEEDYLDFGDGSGILNSIFGIFSGIIFICNLFLMVPYYFLFMHFYKADKANN